MEIFNGFAANSHFDTYALCISWPGIISSLPRQPWLPFPRHAGCVR